MRGARTLLPADYSPPCAAQDLSADQQARLKSVSALTTSLEDIRRIRRTDLEEERMRRCRGEENGGRAPAT